MFSRHYVGRDLFNAANYGPRQPVSRITLFVDDDNVFTAGDDTGLELTAKCPYATESMAKALLSIAKGVQYTAYEATAANLDPAAELGDGVTLDGIYSVLAQISDNGDGYPDISFPGEDLIEEEYPGIETPEENFDRKIATTRSLISKTAEEIRLEVQGVDKRVAAIDISLDEITLTISGINRDVTALELRADGIEASVSSVKTGLSQTVRIASDGVTITNAAGSKLTIDGGQIDATSLKVAAANVTGKLTATQIDASSLKVAAANITGKLKLSQMASISFGDLSDADDVRSEFGDGLTEDDVYTYIDESLVAAPTIAGGVFMDYDQDYSFYLDKTYDRQHFAMVLEDDNGEIFTVISNRSDESIASIALREYTILALDGNTFYAYGNWDFSNANVTGL